MIVCTCFGLRMCYLNASIAPVYSIVCCGLTCTLHLCTLHLCTCVHSLLLCFYDRVLHFPAKHPLTVFFSFATPASLTLHARARTHTALRPPAEQQKRFSPCCLLSPPPPPLFPPPPSLWRRHTHVSPKPCGNMLLSVWPFSATRDVRALGAHWPPSDAMKASLHF